MPQGSRVVVKYAIHSSRVFFLRRASLEIGSRPAKSQIMNPSSQRLTVLAVDDSAIQRKLVEHSISRERYSVLFAKNGRQALELFAEHHPDLVITDWDMPDIGGLELCRRIRRDFQGFHSHLILLTGNTDKAQVVEGLAAGADDYLTKPFHSGELVARVEVGRRFVELHRQIQAKNRRLEELALTDALTGLPNRRAIDVWAPRELSATARHDFPFWAVMEERVCTSLKYLP
jgi:PleD family two-component response regulator